MKFITHIESMGETQTTQPQIGQMQIEHFPKDVSSNLSFRKKHLLRPNHSN